MSLPTVECNLSAIERAARTPNAGTYRILRGLRQRPPRQRQPREWLLHKPFAEAALVNTGGGLAVAAFDLGGILECDRDLNAARRRFDQVLVARRLVAETGRPADCRIVGAGAMRIGKVQGCL